MSFIANNPLIAKTVTDTSLPPTGTMGLFPKSDGWYTIDEEGNEKKVATTDELTNDYIVWIQNGVAEVESAQVITEAYENGKIIRAFDADNGLTYSYLGTPKEAGEHRFYVITVLDGYAFYNVISIPLESDGSPEVTHSLLQLLSTANVDSTPIYGSNNPISSGAVYLLKDDVNSNRNDITTLYNQTGELYDGKADRISVFIYEGGEQVDIYISYYYNECRIKSLTGSPTITLDGLTYVEQELDAVAYISFPACDVAPTFTIIGSNISFSGVDCDETGAFVPVAGVNYRLCIRNMGTEIGSPILIGNVARW